MKINKVNYIENNKNIYKDTFMILKKKMKKKMKKYNIQTSDIIIIFKKYLIKI